MDTVTAADFTVETIISEKMWKTFLATQEAKESTHKMNMFHTMFEEEVEKVINKEDKVLGGDNGGEIRITNITFAFNNVKILKLLLQRGKLLANAKMEQIKKIDEDINFYKETELYEITRPVAAFVTFET